MRQIIFRRGRQLYSVPFSYANRPQVKRLLENSVIVEHPRIGGLKLYRLKKRLIHTTYKEPAGKLQTKYKPPKRAYTRPWHPMNLGLQRNIFENELRAQGISTDLIDLKAHLDSTLSYSENKANIDAQLRNLGRGDLTAQPISASELDYEERRFVESQRERQEHANLGLSLPNINMRDFDVF